MLGRSGHQIGRHYVLRYIKDYGALKIYRDGYEAIRIDSFRLQVAACLMVYGFICSLVACVEGTIRAFERRASRRRGFEVLQIPCTSNDSHSATAIPACRPRGN